MISPPKFYEDLADQSGFEDQSFEIAPSEELPCSPESLSAEHQKILETLDAVHLEMEGRQIASAVRKLESLLQKINVMKNVSRNSDKNMGEVEIDQIQFICLYHLSYGYSDRRLEQDEKLMSINQKLINFMQTEGRNLRSSSRIQLLRSKNKNSIKLKKTVNLNTSNEIQLRENNIKFQQLYAKFLLFSCFKLSIAEKHSLALIQAEEAYRIILNIFEILDDNSELSPGHRHANDKIEFSKIISEQALPIIKSIKKKAQVENVDSSESLQLIKSCVCSWTKNPQQSRADLKSSYLNLSCSEVGAALPTKQEEKRNILGVKSLAQNKKQRRIKPEKSKPQCIKDLVELETVTYKQLCRMDGILYETSGERLQSKVELLCAAYFCMGVELWNVESEEIEYKKSQYFSNGVKTQKLNRRKKEGIQKSELFQLKSIEIAMSYLTSYQSLIDSLIRAYQRKFQGNLITISEENSKFQISSSISQAFQKQSCKINLKNYEKNQAKFSEEEQIMMPKQAYYIVGKNDKFVKKVLEKKEKKLSSSSYGSFSKKKKSFQSHKNNKLKVHVPSNKKVKSERTTSLSKLKGLSNEKVLHSTKNCFSKTTGKKQINPNCLKGVSSKKLESSIADKNLSMKSQSLEIKLNKNSSLKQGKKYC